MAVATWAKLNVYDAYLLGLLDVLCMRVAQRTPSRLLFLSRLAVIRV